MRDRLHDNFFERADICHFVPSKMPSSILAHPRLPHFFQSNIPYARWSHHRGCLSEANGASAGRQRKFATQKGVQAMIGKQVTPSVNSFIGIGSSYLSAGQLVALWRGSNVEW
jgi:hypothetical protein